jgi:hypothetical protein
MDLDGIGFGAIVITDGTASASFAVVFGVDESLLVNLAGHVECLLRAGIHASAASLALVLDDDGTGQSRLLGL